MSILSWILVKRGVSYEKLPSWGFVSCGQGPKAARVLPENLEKALNFPDKGSIFTRLKVQEFKVTSPAAPPHSHTARLCPIQIKIKSWLKLKDTLLGNSCCEGRRWCNWGLFYTESLLLVRVMNDVEQHRFSLTMGNKHKSEEFPDEFTWC